MQEERCNRHTVLVTPPGEINPTQPSKEAAVYSSGISKEKSKPFRGTLESDSCVEILCGLALTALNFSPLSDSPVTIRTIELVCVDRGPEHNLALCLIQGLTCILRYDSPVEIPSVIEYLTQRVVMAIEPPLLTISTRRNLLLSCMNSVAFILQNSCYNLVKFTFITMYNLKVV